MRIIKTALLAYGASGKLFHAPFLAIHSGFALAGAWERTSKNITSDYPDAKSYDSLEALLNDDIDLVVVNTPVFTHFEYAKASLLAGKHVLVEKAFTANASEAMELKRLAEEKNLKLTVYQNRRWDSDFKTVRQIYDRKILGDIVEAEIHFDRYNPNLSPKLHKETVNSGSGVLKDLGSHIIDQALLLFGFPDALFADVRFLRDDTLVDDWFEITLFYEKTRVRLKAGFFVREPLPAYILHGSKGSFLKHRADVQEDALKSGRKPDQENWGREPDEMAGLLHTEIDGRVAREKVSAIAGNYYDFFEMLYQYIAASGAAPVSISDAINTMRIIEAAIQSDEQKTMIYFNI